MQQVMQAPPVIRCAIYTRKSVDEGLEQEFNSLDAQRLACESYIAAKRMDGWVCLPERYDDGGYSGGNMNRPAIQRMLEDVKAGRINMIVCYKIDRLSRSLLEFTRFFGILEEHNASFTCVTQELNTSTSMGRMVMNLLMTFAQFEREMTIERVRDKIHATRKKGIWSGGQVPYGYKSSDRRLIPDPETAPNVQKIFEWYLELGTPKLVVRKLNEAGIRRYADREHDWNTVMIGTMLRNCIYIGRVPLKKESFHGVHEAIVTQEVWDKVQAQLKEFEVEHRKFNRQAIPALLTGMVRCGHCGDALSYTWTGKNTSGTRKYGYYACRKDQRRGVSTCPVKSVPSQLLEPLVEDAVLKLLRTPTMSRALAAERQCAVFEIQRQLNHPEIFWSGMSTIQRHDLLCRYVEAVYVYRSSIDIKFKTRSDSKLIEEYKHEHHED